MAHATPAEPPAEPLGPPRRLGPKEAILALLLAADGKKDNGEWRWAAPIEGKTRLVKELFLVEKETKSGVSGSFTFEFTPGPFGPSSIDVTHTLDALLRDGRVVGEPFAGGRGVRIRLSPSGGKVALAEWPTLPDALRADLFRIKSRMAQMTYREFLVYVYRTYPEYTENSLIRDEVLEEYAD